MGGRNYIGDEKQENKNYNTTNAATPANTSATLAAASLKDGAAAPVYGLGEEPGGDVGEPFPPVTKPVPVGWGFAAGLVPVGKG